MQKKRFIVIDYENCVGCYTCALVCSASHHDIFSLALARVVPIPLRKFTKNIPTLCMHCSEPLCMDVCPVNAITADNDTGAVIINTDLCIGCRMCTVVCPLGAVFVSHVDGKVVKCDLCGGDPLCVKACGYGALSYVTADDDSMNRKRKGIEKISQVLKLLMEA